MAIVTALRFTPRSGAICVDGESWHIRGRKNHFTEQVYSLIPGDLVRQTGCALVYGGVGHPPFHYTVAQQAKQRIAALLATQQAQSGGMTVEPLARCVLDCFHQVHTNRVDNALRFFFGFSRADYTSGRFNANGREYAIKQQGVLDRAHDIVSGKEQPGRNAFTPPVEACLAGLDPEKGYSAYVLKETDGVLGFQSCWFESLGQGRDGAAAGFARHLSQRFLDSRRKGMGPRRGLVELLDAFHDANTYYSMLGGGLRMVIIDGEDPDDSRIRDVRGNEARMLLEITSARKAGFIDPETAETLVHDVVWGKLSFGEAEKALFQSATDPCLLGRLLRQFKQEGAADLPQGPENRLFLVSQAEKEMS